MTRPEAIEILKSTMIKFKTFENGQEFLRFFDALEMAISSLETDEAYQLEYEKPITAKDISEAKIDYLSKLKTTYDFEVPIDEFEEWKLNEDKDCYLRIGDIVDRFKEIDEHYNHSPWNLTQIFSNLNILQRVECKMELPTTKNDLGIDCISRAEVLKLMRDNWHTHNGDWAMQESMDDIRALPSVTPQEPNTGHCKDCKWWKDSDGVYRRGVGTESQCPINTHAVCCGEGYCYMFEPQEVKDKE